MESTSSEHRAGQGLRDWARVPGRGSLPLDASLSVLRFQTLRSGYRPEVAPVGNQGTDCPYTFLRKDRFPARIALRHCIGLQLRSKKFAGRFPKKGSLRLKCSSSALALLVGSLGLFA
jgi:hypothetical protein